MKKLSERTHRCPKCGLVMQRDLMSAFLACHIEADTLQAAQAQAAWASAEPLLTAAWSANQLANAGPMVPLLLEKGRPSQSSSNWNIRVAHANSVAETKAQEVIRGGTDCRGELAQGTHPLPGIRPL